jgi:hypothetical protein
MHKRTFVGSGAIGLALLVTGCASMVEGGSSSAASTRSGGAFVLEGEQLWERNTDLLTVLSRMSGVQIRRNDPCPSITMRGAKTYMGSLDPHIYVNGTQAGNTCLLEMMRTDDVERIEVHPSGVSNRPEYAPSPNGLILIFLRSGHPDD